MQVLLVVNRTAAAVTDDNLLAVQAALGVDHEVVVAETERRCHAGELAAEAAADGVDAVVVLAGDGTLNEAANGLVGTSTALGVLPGGSTNVFARTIGMGRRPVPAVSRLCAAMAARSQRRIGLGKANDRHFLFHVGIGFDAAVVEHVEEIEQRLPLKRAVGQVVFAYSAVATWLCRYDRSGPRFTVRFAGSADPVDATFAICLNTDPYTFVGPRPLHVDPSATLDSALSLATFANLDLRTMAGVLASSLSSSGGLRDGPAVKVRRDLHEVAAESSRPFPWQVDGDLAGTTTSLILSHRPDSLELFLPVADPAGV